MIRSALRSYRAAFAGLPRSVWWLCAVALVNRAGTMVVPFIALYLAREREFGTAAAGRLIGLFGLGSLLGSYVGGWWSDRFGARSAMAFSLTGGGFAFLWFGSLRSTWSIAIAVFLVGAISDSFRPANMAAIAICSPDEVRSRAFALLRLAVNIGMGIGPALGGLMAVHSYSWLFIADAASCWVAAVVVLWTIRPLDMAPSDASSGSSAAWSDRPFLMLLAVVFCLGCVFFQVFATLPLTLRDLYGLAENSIGLLLGFNALLIVLFEMLLIHRLEARNRLYVVAAGCAFTCLGLGLTPLGSTVGFALLCVAIWTLGEMTTLPMLNVIVADRASASHRGRYMGMYTMAYALAFIVAPLIGTQLYARWGAAVLWYSVGAMAIPLGWACMRLAPLFPRPSERQPA